MAAVHSTLDPTKMKAGIRECRDSDTHVNTTPVFVGLDVTGSMSSVPTLIQEKLPQLMGLLIRKNYLEDPSICVAGIGDYEMGDRVPFQIGQFESGIEIDEQISSIYLEGNGGGNRSESYHLALYFLARCVKSDAWEKRNRKGHAFIICDESLASTCPRKSIKAIFNIDEETDIPTKTLMTEVMEKWHLHVIVPKMTQHYRSSLQESWKDYLGENVIFLEDPSTIVECIASRIGLEENNVDIDDLHTDLTDVGLSTDQVNAVTTALSKVNSGVPSTKLSGTGLATL